MLMPLSSVFEMASEHHSKSFPNPFSLIGVLSSLEQLNAD
jgi:hypothetical protein